MSEKKTNAQPPEELTGLELNEPQQYAAGIPAVKEAVKQVFSEVGVGRGIKTLFQVNQMGGYDCPGCAWPDPDDHRSGLGEYCENGAKAIAEEATRKKADPAFWTKYSVEELGSWSDYKLGRSGRITHPMVLNAKGHYETISWDNAFELIKEELRALNSPDEAIFYTSGRTSNEAAFLYQLFVRQFGTNNLPDCSNMCHESSGFALTQTVGIGKGSVTLEDFEHAEVVVVMGQNPGTNHPRMLSALQKAKKNGTKIVTINPLPEAGLIKFKNPQSLGNLLSGGTDLTDLFLQVRINGDVALLKALMKLILEADKKKGKGIIDHDFIAEKTTGYESLLEDLEKFSLESLAVESGLEIDEIKEVAQLLIDNKRIIVCWAMGLTQHKNGVDNIREIVNLLLMKGSIGIQGGGTCPVRGHSNVQGDRTMGIFEKPPQALLDSLERNFDFKPPQHHGYDVVEAIKAMKAGKGKVFFAMGGNFLSATPDTEYTAEALRLCNLTVHVSTKPNRSHLVHGKKALILPCLGRTDIDRQKSGEQFVSVENSMGVVHSSRGHLEPTSSELLSEPTIVARLADSVLTSEQTSLNWLELATNYDLIRDLIEKTIPGFDDYNKRVRNKSGFYLPNGARVGEFKTSDGKAHFSVNKINKLLLDEGEYMMMTIRTHDQYNTTIYGLDDRYRGILNERRVVMMNEEDIADSNFNSGDLVDIINTSGGIERVASKFIIVKYPIPRKCVATYFPEANVLVPITSVAEGSNTPASKLVVVNFRKHIS